MSNSVKFKTSSEKFHNELSGEKNGKATICSPVLPFMIHKSRDSCYRHKLPMKLEKLFILSKKSG